MFYRLSLIILIISHTYIKLAEQNFDNRPTTKRYIVTSYRQTIQQNRDQQQN